MNYRDRCYNSFVSKHWKYYYSLSQADFNFMIKPYRKRYKRFLPADRNAKIIDIACGAGHFLYFLKSEGYTNIAGIDISKEQLEVAKKMGIENVEEANLFSFLPKHQEEYEMIVAIDIIEHLTKDEVLVFLDAIYSALCPGGIALIGTVNASSVFGSRMVYIDFTHETGFTMESLAQVMRLCNFENIDIYGEKPTAHDVKSTIRSGLWWILEKFTRAFIAIERGTGRDLYQRKHILESRMFAIGRKNNESRMERAIL